MGQKDWNNQFFLHQFECVDVVVAIVISQVNSGPYMSWTRMHGIVKRCRKFRNLVLFISVANECEGYLELREFWGLRLSMSLWSRANRAEPGIHVVR